MWSVNGAGAIPEARDPVNAPTLKISRRAALGLFVFLVCLLLPPALLEGVLRLADYGEPTGFLLRKVYNDRIYYVPNRAFYQQFSSLPLDRIMTWDTLDFQAPEDKAPGTRRILVFGSSAIYGTRASARILEVLLEARCPEYSWEVYNAACPGMNSHVMRAAAKACAALKPDLCLVYMGNNEAVGPFGPTTTLGRLGPLWRPPVIRFLIAMNGLRVTQLLRANRAMTALNLPDTDALMDMMPSMTDHHRALQYYADNLEDMCEAAKKEGAHVVLCTLSSNKRFMGQVSPQEPDFNGLSINGIVRDLAARLPYTRLADVENTLREHSEDGLPGYEYFYDNVHFNFDGNYLAARTMLDAVTGLVSPAVNTNTAPLSKEACAQRLAWTDAAEFDLLGWQMQAFQDEHTRARTRDRYETLQQRLGPSWREQLARDHLAALEYRPGDLYLRHACFNLFLEPGRLEEAQAQQAELDARHPAARVTLRAKGILEDRRGDTEAAIAAYRQCLALYPDDPPALKALGERLFAGGALREAETCFKKFLRANPDDIFVWCRMGELQKKHGEPGRARNTYESIAASAPKHPLAYRLLDELMTETDTPAVRTVYWDTVMKQHPEAAEPRVRRALLHLAAGEKAEGLELLRQAAALAPEDPAVQYLFGEAAAAQGAYEEAEHALREATRLQPADARNRLLLLQTLIARGNLDAAKEALEWCDSQEITVPPELRQRLSAP